MDIRVEAVRLVVRRTLLVRAPVQLRVLARLTEVCEGHDITRLIVCATLVRDPHFDLVDLRTRGDIRNRGHRFLVVVAEEITEEEMSVLVVVVARDVELRHLCTALTAHRLRLAVLLTD